MVGSVEADDSPEVYYSSLEEQYLAREGVDLRRSLDGAGLAFDGRIFAFPDRDDAVIVKLTASEVTAAVAAGDGERYRLGSRAMRAWLRIPFDDDAVDRWDRYVERAYELSRGISVS